MYCGDSLFADKFKYTPNIYENIKIGQKYPICYMFVRNFLSHVSSELHLRMNLYLTHLFSPNGHEFVKSNLSFKKNLRLSIITQKGRVCNSSGVWIGLHGSGLLVYFTDKIQEGLKGQR